MQIKVFILFRTMLHFDLPIFFRLLLVLSNPHADVAISRGHNKKLTDHEIDA